MNMNNIEITQQIITKTYKSLAYRIMDMKLGLDGYCKFIVEIFDSNAQLITAKILTMENFDYLQWGFSDIYAENWILSKLDLTRLIINSPEEKINE